MQFRKEIENIADEIYDINLWEGTLESLLKYGFYHPRES